MCALSFLLLRRTCSSSSVDKRRSSSASIRRRFRCRRAVRKKNFCAASLALPVHLRDGLLHLRFRSSRGPACTRTRTAPPSTRTGARAPGTETPSPPRRGVVSPTDGRVDLQRPPEDVRGEAPSPRVRRGVRVERARGDPQRHADADRPCHAREPVQRGVVPRVREHDERRGRGRREMRQGTAARFPRRSPRRTPRATPAPTTR